MFNFVYYLKSIATILITNSHYGKIWPSSEMAIGGLLGNVLFFAVSGFCLFEIKDGFIKWYGKRFLRIYPLMFVFTLITVMFGAYSLKSWSSAVYLFLYPTNYVFIVWILVLYIAFYLIAWFSKKYLYAIEIALAVLFVLWVAVYLIFIDKSRYIVDDVYKPFIMFLYFARVFLSLLITSNIDLLRYFFMRITDKVCTAFNTPAI